MEANVWTQERRGDQCSVSLPVFFLIPQGESMSAPTPSFLSHASICLLLSLCACLSQILVTFALLPLCLPLFLPSSSLTLQLSIVFPVCLFLFLSASSLLFLLLHSPISPPGLLCLLFVFSSRSPPAEDGDVSCRCGYCGVAVGITAATSVFRTDREERERDEKGTD